MKQDQLRPQIAALTDAVVALTEALLALDAGGTESLEASEVKPSRDTSTFPDDPALLTIAEFLDEAQISYSTYRKLRLQGRAPAELRLSARVIRLSRQAVDEWRQRNERVVARPPLVPQTSWPFAYVRADLPVKG